MNRPVFRIINITNVDNTVAIIIENSNNVYYTVDNISFSTNDIRISITHNGSVTLTNQRTQERTIYKGIGINLHFKSIDFYVGNLKIAGHDSIGNNFCVITEDIKFMNKKIYNNHDLTNSYLKYI